MFKKLAPTNVYILKLVQGKYYVGASQNVLQRYKQHLDGKGAAWTKTFRPIQIEEMFEMVSPFEEDRRLKEYMGKYGIENVRGGSYVRKQLYYEQKYALQQEIRGAYNLCKSCGKEGHFETNCKKPLPYSGTSYNALDIYIFTCKECEREFESEKEVSEYVCECKGPIRKVLNKETEYGRVMTYKMTGYPVAL